VAPELEFFLVEPNIDSDYPLKPPVGRSGRPESAAGLQHRGRQRVRPAVRRHVFVLRAQDIEIDTLIHEAGAAQMEINLLHGNP